MEKFILVYPHGILLEGSHSQIPWKTDSEVNLNKDQHVGSLWGNVPKINP